MSILLFEQSNPTEPKLSSISIVLSGQVAPPPGKDVSLSMEITLNKARYPLFTNLFGERKKRYIFFHKENTTAKQLD